MSALWRRRKSLGPVALPPLPVTATLLESVGAKHQVPDNATGIACGQSDFTGNYELGGALGSGTTAVVRRARCFSDGREVAVKCIASCEDEVREFARMEFALVRGLKHPSIVRMEKLFEGPLAIWICMELAPTAVSTLMFRRMVRFRRTRCKLLARNY